MRSNKQLTAGREISPPFFLGRLIIRPVRFLYFFGWLGAVFCGPVGDLHSGSHLQLQNFLTRCHRSFVAHRTNFIFCNIVLLTVSCICLHACCFYYPGPASPGPRAPSPLKHETYAKSCWVLALQESLWRSDFVSHNPALSGCSSALWALVWPSGKNSTSSL